MSALYDLGSCLGEILLVFHVSLDLSDSLLISWNLHLLIKVHLLSGLLSLEVEDTCFLEIYLRFDSESREFLEDFNSVSIPCGAVEGVEFMDLVLDLSESRSLHTGNFHSVEIYISDRYEVRLEFVPESCEIVVSFQGGIKIFNKLLRLVLGLLHLKTERRLLVLQGREGVPSHLELFVQVVERSLIILKLYCHNFCFFLPLTA